MGNLASTTVTTSQTSGGGAINAGQYLRGIRIIVRAQANDVDELGRLVAQHIQSVPGITRTLTCPVVHI